MTPHIILKYLDALDGDLSDQQARNRLLDEYVSRVLVDDGKVTVVLLSLASVGGSKRA